MVSLSVEKGRRSAAAAPVGHPAAGSATLGIGLGLGVGWRLGEPRHLSPWPPPPLIGTVRRGLTSQTRAERPRSGREIRAHTWPLGQV
jgi:hypothetical protein